MQVNEEVWWNSGYFNLGTLNICSKVKPSFKVHEIIWRLLLDSTIAKWMLSSDSLHVKDHVISSHTFITGRSDGDKRSYSIGMIFKARNEIHYISCFKLLKYKWKANSVNTCILYCIMLTIKKLWAQYLSHSKKMLVTHTLIQYPHINLCGQGICIFWRKQDVRSGPKIG